MNVKEVAAYILFVNNTKDRLIVRAASFILILLVSPVC